MTLRWLETFWRLRCFDAQGASRAVKYPSMPRLRRIGLPHPVRSFLRISPWWWWVLFLAPVLGQLAVKSVLVAVFGVHTFSRVLTYSVLGLPRGTVYLLGYLLFLMLAYSVLLQFYSRFIRGRYVNEMLDNARCPWCTYDLSGNKHDEDNTTQCPECGGVWRLP